MRRSTYTDNAGRIHVVLLPDDAPDSHATLGIPVGPPSLAALGLPEELEIRLHNQLVARNVLTAADAKARRSDILGALQKALSMDTDRVATCYNENATE
jgi:hypothetical protein